MNLSYSKQDCWVLPHHGLAPDPHLPSQSMSVSSFALLCLAKNLRPSAAPLSLTLHTQSTRKSCSSAFKIDSDHFSPCVNSAPHGPPSVSLWSTQQPSRWLALTPRVSYHSTRPGTHPAPALPSPGEQDRKPSPWPADGWPRHVIQPECFFPCESEEGAIATPEKLAYTGLYVPQSIGS